MSIFYSIVEPPPLLPGLWRNSNFFPLTATEQSVHQCRKFDLLPDALGSINRPQSSLKGEFVMSRKKRLANLCFFLWKTLAGNTTIFFLMMSTRDKTEEKTILSLLLTHFLRVYGNACCEKIEPQVQKQDPFKTTEWLSDLTDLSPISARSYLIFMCLGLLAFWGGILIDKIGDPKEDKCHHFSKKLEAGQLKMNCVSSP